MLPFWWNTKNGRSIWKFFVVCHSKLYGYVIFIGFWKVLMKYKMCNDHLLYFSPFFFTPLIYKRGGVWQQEDIRKSKHFIDIHLLKRFLAYFEVTIASITFHCIVQICNLGRIIELKGQLYQVEFKGWTCDLELRVSVL